MGNKRTFTGRTFTGRTLTGRTRVVACGYFGWLDWCSDADGVLPADRAGFVLFAGLMGRLLEHQATLVLGDVRLTGT